MTAVVSELGRNLFFMDDDLPTGPEKQESSPSLDLTANDDNDSLVDAIGKKLFFTDLDDDFVPTEIDVNPQTYPSSKDHNEPTSVVDEIQRTLFFTDVPDDCAKINEIKRLQLQEDITTLEQELRQAQRALDKIRIQETKLELVRKKKAEELRQAKRRAKLFKEALEEKEKADTTSSWTSFMFG